MTLLLVFRYENYEGAHLSYRSKIALQVAKYRPNLMLGSLEQVMFPGCYWHDPSFFVGDFEAREMQLSQVDAV